MTRTIENLLKIAVFFFAVWVLSQFVNTRYQIVGVSNYVAYKLDNWTGQVYMIAAQEERVVHRK
jgi:hypothetical protein